MITKSKGRVLGVVTGLVALPFAALAHHGITGSYDTSTPLVIAGTVTAATFAPPHPVLSVEVDEVEVEVGDVGRPDEFTGPFVRRSEDIGQVLEVEFSPVRTFYDLAGEVRVGDRVVVLALRNCLPPNQLRSSWVQLADGQVVSYEGGLHVKVDGCS